MVSRTPSERSSAKGGLWSAIPTTSRSLDVGARSCPEADRVGLSWPKSPTGHPLGGRPTPRTTSGKARTGLLGEGGVRMSSPCAAPLGWAWSEGKHTASCPARGALAHLSPERQGERGRTKGGIGSIPATQCGPPLPHQIFPKSDPPYSSSASIPLTWVSVLTRSPPLGSGPLGHGPLSGTKTCPLPKEEAGAHACSVLGARPGAPLAIDVRHTTAMLSILTMTCECVRNGRKWARARRTALSTPGRLCAGWGTCLTRHRKPVVPQKPLLTPRGKHLSLSFGDGRLPPYVLQNWETLLVGMAKAWPRWTNTQGLRVNPNYLSYPFPLVLRVHVRGLSQFSFWSRGRTKGKG